MIYISSVKNKKLRLLILADRFYPDIVGGGEVSLYYIVQGIKKIKDIETKVIAQSEASVEDTVACHDKVEIQRVPIKLNVSISNMRLKRLRSGIVEIFFRFAQFTHLFPLVFFGKALLIIRYWFHYLFKKTNSHFFTKFSLLLSNFISLISSKENLEYLESDFNCFIDSEPLYQLIRKTECDVVHADNTRSILRYIESGAQLPTVAVVRDLKFFCPRRTIIANSSHGPCNECHYQCLDDFPRFQRPFIKRVFEANMAYRLDALKRHNVVVCTSAFLQGLIYKTADIKSRVLPNPVMIHNKIANIKINKKSSNAGQKTLLFVGMLVYNKGADIAIDVLDHLLHDGIPTKIFMAGRGFLEKLIIKKARELNIEKHVELLGFLEEEKLLSYYQIADVLICPVRWPEPFGRVALEASGCGTPVVAYNLGGFSETILDGETGFLATPGDAVDFISKVKMLLLDDNLRKNMSKRCLQWVKEKFCIEKIVHEYIEIYKEVKNYKGV